MFSLLSDSNTPEQWLFIIVLVLMLGSMIGLLTWGVILEIRFTSPFTLIKTSNREKWRKATILALMLTAMLPIFGMAMLAIYSPDERLPMFLLCNGLWVIAFPLAILYKRWEFESHIKRYRRLDKMIKENSPYTRILASPLTNIVSFFMTAEQKRFFKEGFPVDIDERINGDYSVPEQSDDFKSK
jgi:hypothetical protein